MADTANILVPPEGATGVLDAAADGANEIALSRHPRSPSKHTAWDKFISWIWDPCISSLWFNVARAYIDRDYFEKSDEERRLVQKLDWFMLPALTLGWWIKNVDQSNLTNAYVSGLKEDLNITGNQYTYMLTIYAAVVAGMQLPSNFIALKVRPSYFLAASEIGWTIFTFAQAGAHSYQAMYGFRFCVALFESAYYPICFFVLGSWYTKPELAKRISLWFIASPAGSAFSGFMQAAIYKTLNGKAGLAGWRWLFIIGGLMSVPIGIILFFFVPDFPENTRAWYLNDREKALVKERMARNGTAAVHPTIRKQVIIDSLKTWQFWTFVPYFTFIAIGVTVNTQFAVYLKAFKYSVTLRNVMPASSNCIQIVTIIFYSWVSDQTVKRWGRAPIMIWTNTLLLFTTTTLFVWPNNNALRIAAFIVSYCSYETAIFFTWVAETCAGRTEQRAFITGSATALWYATNAWLPTIIYKQTDGPRFKKGFTTSFACNIVGLVLLASIQLLWLRDKRRAAKQVAEHEVTKAARDYSTGVSDAASEEKALY